MSMSVQQVMNEAQKLVMRLKEYDNNTDNLMVQTQTLNKCVESMKEYHEEMSALSSLSHEKPRSSIIVTIQRESKQLRQLENENRELKCALEDHHFALELIMSKYRQQINNLIKVNDSEKGFHLFVNNSNDTVQRQTNKIIEMVAVMNKAIQIDEIQSQKERKLLSQLKLENDGLREMMKIARLTIAPQESPKKVSSDKEVQTDDYSNENVN